MAARVAANDFGARLANAHADAADGLPVLQIGMDTPQVTAELLAGCARRLLDAPARCWPTACAPCRCRPPTPAS